MCYISTRGTAKSARYLGFRGRSGELRPDFVSGVCGGQVGSTSRLFPVFSCDPIRAEGDQVSVVTHDDVWECRVGDRRGVMQACNDRKRHQSISVIN